MSFPAHSFTPDDPKRLAEALVAQAWPTPEASARPGFRDVNPVFADPPGDPSDKRPWVVSVWSLEEGGGTARPVTAHPLRRRE